MALPANQDRLRASLLDRLSKNFLGRLAESDRGGSTKSLTAAESERQRRGLVTLEEYRELVLLDLTWLFNSGSLESCVNLMGLEEVQRSVLNFGIPELAGSTATSLKLDNLEKRIKQAILNFEPRIDPESLDVRAVRIEEEMSQGAVCFEIRGKLWAYPVPIDLFLRTEIDLESGQATVAAGQEDRFASPPDGSTNTKS